MNKKVKSEEVKDLPMTNLDNIFFVIDVDLYMCQFMISVNQDNTQLADSLIDERVLSSLHDPDYEMYMGPFLGMKKTTLATTAFYPSGVVAVKLNQFSTGDPDCMSILVHELSHAVMFTFDRIGMPHNGDTDEAYSYLLGFLMKKFFENIR